MKQKIGMRSYVTAFCIAMSSNMGFSVAYAYTSYYVAFQTATGFTNTQLGLLLTVLGIASTVLYLPGGFLADRFNVRTLTTVGLIGAGATGFLIALFPSYSFMMLIYCAFAVFAVLIAWNPQMKMLRMLSSDEDQGKIQTARAYGRTLPVLIISLGGSALLALLPTEKAALQVTLCLYGALAIIPAIIAAFTFKPVAQETAPQAPVETSSISLREYLSVMKMKDVWLIGLIGFSAYTANAGITYLQPYLTEIFGISAATSSAFGIIAKNCALLSAPILTFLGGRKKMSVTKALGLALAVSAVCVALFILMPMSSGMLLIAVIIYMVAALGIMGSWALQFTPVAEIGIPMAISGTAIGIISMFSFVSDIFFSAICGNLLDRFGLDGYKYVFALTVVILVAGVLACFNIAKKVQKSRQEQAAAS